MAPHLEVRRSAGLVLEVPVMLPDQAVQVAQAALPDPAVRAAALLDSAVRVASPDPAGRVAALLDPAVQEAAFPALGRGVALLGPEQVAVAAGLAGRARLALAQEAQDPEGPGVQDWAAALKAMPVLVMVSMETLQGLQAEL